MEITPNVGLTLPAENEYYDINVVNENNIKIDTKLTETATIINELKSTKADKSTVYTKPQTDTTRTYTLTHAKNGTAHTLAHLPTTNGIFQCQFKAVANYAEGDTFEGYKAKPIGEDTTLPDKAFITGDLVSVVVDTESKKLGFKLGGSTYGTLSPQIKNFTAKAGNHEITLSWTNPSDSNFAGLYLVRKQGSMPTKLSDGIKIDVGKATTYTDNEPENGIEYYYRAFTYNAKKQVQTELTGAVVSATPKSTKIMTVKINLNESNPEACCTYADDAVGMTPKSQEWDDFFGHKPCLFKNGAVVGYLNPNDFTKFEDGSSADIISGNSGDVMIEFPRRGLKIETVNNIITISMTDAQDDTNFEYMAHTRWSIRKEKFYLGAYKGNTISSKLRSLSGKAPTATQTIGTFRTQAQANGAGYDQSGFYQLTFRQAMYLLKYKNLNSQTAVGRGYVDGNSAAINTGGTETKGMDWGETTGKQHVKLFGIEDFWGNAYEWIEGLSTDSSWNIFTTTSEFNDSSSGYVNQGISGVNYNSSGYINGVQGNTKTGFIGKKFEGSGTTFFCDNGAIYKDSIPIFGGSWDDGNNTGIFKLSLFRSVGQQAIYIGARLMYL